MTPPAQPHPQRCVLCKKMQVDDNEIAMCEGVTIPVYAYRWIERYGCASHSASQQRIERVRIHRTWAMPNKNTFSIPQIKNLIDRFGWDWVDPFPDPYQKDALEYLKGFKDSSVSYLLFDPPYSPRQLKECYESNGQSLHDTTSSVWKRWKDEIARVMKPNGICISFGWSTNGLGKNRGFEIVEILLVAHGGNHNDTICTVEQKAIALLQAGDQE